MRKIVISLLMVCAFGISVAAGCESTSPSATDNATNATVESDSAASQNASSAE